MFCKFCGSEIEDGSVFCNKCGKSQEDAAQLEEKIKKSKKIFYLAAIGGVIALAVIVALLLIRSMTAIEIVSKSVEAGSIVDAKDIVIAKSGNASVKLTEEIDTSKIGACDVKCEISNGIFNSEETITVNVVDTTKPVIDGPKSITIISGQKFVPSDYYTVDDFEENLADKIVMSPELDTDKEGKQKIVLSATDSSGNKGDLSVEINVLKLTVNEEKVLQVINQYIADGNSKEDILSAAWIMKTTGGGNGVDYYVEVANNVLYAIDYSGEISEFTVSDCGGDTTLYELMVYAVHYNATSVNTSKLLN